MHGYALPYLQKQRDANNIVHLRERRIILNSKEKSYYSGEVATNRDNFANVDGIACGHGSAYFNGHHNDGTYLNSEFHGIGKIFFLELTLFHS